MTRKPYADYLNSRCEALAGDKPKKRKRRVKTPYTDYLNSRCNDMDKASERVGGGAVSVGAASSVWAGRAAGKATRGAKDWCDRHREFKGK